MEQENNEINKIYKEVKKKFEEMFKSNKIRETLEFDGKQIYFMKGTEVSITATDEYCLLETESGAIRLSLESFDFDKKVKAIMNLIAILTDIISMVMDITLKQIALDTIKVIKTSDLISDIINKDDNKKELLN